MNIHIYHHYANETAILRELSHICIQMENIMSTLDLLLDDVRAQKTQTDSVTALLANIRNQLRDALTGEKLSPAAEAKLAAIMPQLEANTTEITDAINANTNTVPPAPVIPTPTAPSPPSQPQTGRPTGLSSAGVSQPYPGSSG